MSRVRASSLGGEGLGRGGRAAGSTSTPRARILATNWSCSYWARSTQSTSSKSSSSWFVGVSRFRLRSGRWTMTLRSLPDLRVHAELAHRPPRLLLTPSGTTVVPARALDDLLDVLERADGRPLPGRLDEAGGGLDLRAHRPGGERPRPQLVGGDPVEPALLGCAPAVVDAVDVGRHDEEVGADLAGEQLAGQVLVDHRLDAAEGAVLPRHPRRRDPAAAGADDDTSLLEQPADGPDLEDPLRLRATARPGGGARRPA